MRAYTQIDAHGNAYISEFTPDTVWLMYANQEAAGEHGAWVPWSILQNYPPDVTLEDVEIDIIGEDS